MRCQSIQWKLLQTGKSGGEPANVGTELLIRWLTPSVGGQSLTLMFQRGGERCGACCVQSL